MPFSLQPNKQWFIDIVKTLKIETMLDVGAGAGTYAEIFEENFPMVHREGIEAWSEYILKFDLYRKYAKLYNYDVRKHENFKFDIVIFGDVLEHMPKEDAVALWEKVSKQAKYALIAIPIIDYPQDDVDNNPYMRHVKDDWTHEEVLETFKCIDKFKTDEEVGSYFAVFN